MAKLTYRARKNIPKKKFAIPSKAPASGSYPIPDAAHARNALARVSQHGTPSEKATVRAKVASAFPAIAQGGQSPQQKFERMRMRQGARHH